jgi:enoyl-CoA hydratase/carnithine racemase
MIMAEDTPEILVEESETYARIIINRPHVRNAITAGMWETLPKLVRRLQRQAGVRSLVLSGAGGKAFASGADISELPRFTDPRAARAFETLVVRALESLVRCPLPVVAMIHGYAVGGGCHIAAACDLRIAGESAQLGIPAAKLGASVNPGVTARLVSLVGQAVAKEILFSGQPLDARRALQVGLVNHVVPDAELEGFTLALVRQIGANAPLTIRAAKRAVNWIAIEGRRRPAREIQQQFVKAFGSRDFREGLEAFLSKRPPKFQGR